MDAPEAWDLLSRLDVVRREMEYMSLFAALLKGPVRDALKDRIFVTELDEKSAHLAELNRIVGEQDYMQVALNMGWRPSYIPISQT